MVQCVVVAKEIKIQMSSRLACSSLSPSSLTYRATNGLDMSFLVKSLFGLAPSCSKIRIEKDMLKMEGTDEVEQT